MTPDHVAFVAPGRGCDPPDRQGLAVRLCPLPLLGFVRHEVTMAPPGAVARWLSGSRLIRPCWWSTARRSTRTDHLRLMTGRCIDSKAGQPLRWWQCNSQRQRRTDPEILTADAGTGRREGSCGGADLDSGGIRPHGFGCHADPGIVDSEVSKPGPSR